MSIFAGEKNSQSLKQAAEMRGLTVASLSIRYLGMPLTLKVWSKTDCETLIDQLRASSCLECLKLVFAGRLQLIKYVITSTVRFWSSVFILPKVWLDTIESMCSAFLWSGSQTINPKAKVSWAELYYPKKKDDLGFKSYETHPRAFALLLIWCLFTQSGLYWVS